MTLLTVSLGVKNPDELDTTISDLMQVVVDNGNLSPRDNGILKDIEGVDLVPSNIGLSSFEVSLVNTMSREFVLRSYLGAVKRDYDYVLRDKIMNLGAVKRDYDYVLRDKIMNYYNSIAANVQTHSKLPSFFARSTSKAQDVELTWDGARYSATLTDTNNVLGNYTFSASAPRVYCSVSGNKLTITAETTTDGPVTITAAKNNAQRRGIVTWTDSHIGPDGTKQDLVTHAQSVTDPIKGYLNVKISLGSMKIVKTAEDGNVAGIAFNVTGNGLNRTVYTNSAGEIQLNSIAPGVYTVSEQVFDQYKPQESRQITVISGQTTTVTFNNTLRRGDVVVHKTAEDGLAEGTKFHLYGTSLFGAIVDEYAVVDDSGRAYFRNVLVGTGYTLEEVDVPERYVIPSNQSVAIEWKEGPIFLVEVVKANTAQKGVIKVSKTGEVFSTVTENGGVYQPVYTAQGLSGAVFQITAAEDIYTPDGTLRYSTGEVVDTLTTGAAGTAESKSLYLGKFEIREVTAPSGMVVSKEAHSVELTYAGQEVEVTETAASITNQRQKVSVTLEKAMEQNELFGIGMNGEITAVTFGLYAAENLTAADGSMIPSDGLIEIISVDENGHGTAATDLPMGSFYLKERATDSHYILSDEKYPVVFEYAGQDTALVEIKANGGAAIGNRLIYGSVHGLKKDDDGTPLDWALLGLFRADESEFTADNALMTAVSGEDGSFQFDRVPYGNWLVREIASPIGFLLSEVSYPVEISEDGAVIEVEVENTRIRGTVRLTKVDEDYPDNKLSGAEFDVYQDINGNKELDAEDKLVGTLTETSVGVYEMSGVEYGGHFVKERTAPEGFCLDENAYYFEITEHGTVDDSIINRVLRFGTADIQKDYLTTIRETAAGYVREIFRILREREYNPALMRLHVLGGGSCLIRNFGEYDADRVTIYDDICATAKGYEYLCEMALRKGGAVRAD